MLPNGSIERMRRDPSLRHLPQSESSGLPACTAQRWILLGTWAVCCVLLLVLLFTEAQFLPTVTAKGVHVVVAAADFSRYLKPSSDTAGSSKHQSDTGQVNSTENSTAVDLNQLWRTLPFTPVLVDNSTTYEYEFEPQDDALQQMAPGLDSNPAAVQQQYMLAPLQQPRLSNPENQDLAFMAALVAEAIDAEITHAEGRAGFRRAFEAAKPPANSAWHVRTPLASSLRHRQQKGAGYQSTSSSTSGGTPSSSSSSGGSNSRGIQGSVSWAITDDPIKAAGSSNSSTSSTASTTKQQQPQAEQERSSAATEAAMELMSHALKLLAGSNKLAACGTEDSSLPLPPAEVAGGPPGGRLLVAAAVQDNEAAMPNFVLQIVQFALQCAPGSLFVSVFDPGSTDQTAFWLDVLRLLLLPLRVPALITTGGNVNVQIGASQPDGQASLRNMAIDKFFLPAGTANCPVLDSSSRDGNSGAPRDLMTGSSSWNIGSAAGSTILRQRRQQQLQQRWRRLRQLGLRKGARKLGSTMRAADIPGAADALTGFRGSNAAPWGSSHAAVDTAANSIVYRTTSVPQDLQNAQWGLAAAVASVASSSVGNYSFQETSAAVYADGAGSSSSSSTDSAAEESRAVRKTLDTTSSSNSSDTHNSAKALHESAHEESVPALAACFKPNWVVFIDNGVYFCKSDLHRLLMHKTADLACGMDLELAKPAAAGTSSGNATARGLHAAAAGSTAAAAHIDAAGVNMQAAPAVVVDNASILVSDAGTQGSGILKPQQQQQQPQQHKQLLLRDVLSSAGPQQHQDVLVGVLNTQDLQGLATRQQQQTSEHHQHKQQQQQQQQQPTEDEHHLLRQQFQASVMQPTHSGDRQDRPPDVHQQLTSTLSSSSSSSSARLPPAALPVNPTLAKYPFYYGDYGVGRIVTGALLDAVPPYAGAHIPTVRRISAGLPVQVYCCWNGLAKLRAEPFHRGLRFRANMNGECKTTDTALLCDDFHRLGFSKAVIDSGVLVTHQLELSAQISNNIKHADRMPYIRRSRWVEVQGGGSPWLRNELQLRQQTYPALVCCDLPGAANDNNTEKAYDTVYPAIGDQTKNQVVGCSQGLAPGFHMSFEELTSVGLSGRWAIGGGNDQQCKPVRPLANNHTHTFLQQQQQKGKQKDLNQSNR